MIQTHLKELFARIPWPVLLVLGLLIGFAPFQPQPHLLEKLMMLANGSLSRPLDVFDLFFHASPFILIAAKILLTRNLKHDT